MYEVVVYDNLEEPCDPGIPVHIEQGFATRDAADRYAVLCEADGSVRCTVREQQC